MKVIHQLIAYFEERGKLKRKHLEQFISGGYWGLHTGAELRSLEQKVGQSFFFQVTGEVRGPLWGTDTYTSDSDLSTACVHAGLLKPGEAGVVKVRMVPPLTLFKGSMRHGFKSQDWDRGWSGAFQVELVKK